MKICDEFKVALNVGLLERPLYLCDQIRPPISASSLRRLLSSQRHDPFIHRVRTITAHTRSFASIVQSLWNHLPHPLRSFILSAPLFSSLSRLKSYHSPGTEMQ